MKKRYSFFALCLGFSCILYFSFFYYPKWQKEKDESVISWDVSGYYIYLPAVFIYKDLKTLSFNEQILNEYAPTPTSMQTYSSENGTVGKYSIGQSVMYSPFFFTGYLWASLNNDHKVDGYSSPFQRSIAWGSLLIAFLGLFFLRKFLLIYFPDFVVGFCLISIIFASNYLEYASISNALTHNYLFTLYAILLLLSHHFWLQPNQLKAVLIGLVIGLAALTRPTEILISFVPFITGFLHFNSMSLFKVQVKKHADKIGTAIIAIIIVGSTQLLYWKYATGNWFVYSYGEQGFSWLSPHIIDGLFSFKCGWFVYTPLMLLAIPGIYFMILKEKWATLMVLIFSSIFIYLTFSWDEWWYGASLGQRAMIQSYPVLAIPLAFLIKKACEKKTTIVLLISLIAFFSYYNIWLTVNAHNEGNYIAGQMTKKYFQKTFLKWDKSKKDKLFLQHGEEYTGHGNFMTIDLKEFEDISLPNNTKPINGTSSLLMGKYGSNVEVFGYPVTEKAKWYRIKANYKSLIPYPEWNEKTKLELAFISGNQTKKIKSFVINDCLYWNKVDSIQFDVRAPADHNFIQMTISNHEKDKGKLLIDNLSFKALIE